MGYSNDKIFTSGLIFWWRRHIHDVFMGWASRWAQLSWCNPSKEKLGSVPWWRNPLFPRFEKSHMTVWDSHFIRGLGWEEFCFGRWSRLPFCECVGSTDWIWTRYHRRMRLPGRTFRFF